MTNSRSDRDSRSRGEGRRLRQLRRRAGLTPGQLAERAGPFSQRIVKAHRLRRNPKRVIYEVEAGRLSSPTILRQVRQALTVALAGAPSGTF